MSSATLARADGGDELVNDRPVRRARRAGNRGFRPPRAHAKADVALEGPGGRRQMAKLQLSFACGLYDRMQPIYTGEVKPEGIDLNFIVIDQPRAIFDRMAGAEEFDVAEFSSSEFVQRFANKQCPFVAIPVFPSRAFRHGFIAVHRKAGIKTPKDLEGKRVGVPLLTMTAAIYINGLLQHEYGVDLRKIRWVQGAMNTGGAHGSPTVLPLLKPIAVEQNTSNKSMSDLIEERAVDATLGTSLPEAIRSNPDIVRLFPDYVELEKAFYRRTKLYPIMHLVAIRKQPVQRVLRSQEDRPREDVQFACAALHDAVPDARHRRDLRSVRRRSVAVRDRVQPADARSFRHLSHRSVVDRRARSGG